MVRTATGRKATGRGLQQTEDHWETVQMQILSTRCQHLQLKLGECHPSRLTPPWPLVHPHTLQTRHPLPFSDAISGTPDPIMQCSAVRIRGRHVRTGEVPPKPGLFWSLEQSLTSCCQDGSCQGTTCDGVPGVFFPSDLNHATVNHGKQTSPNCKATSQLWSPGFNGCQTPS